MSELPRRIVHASGAGFPLLYLLGLATWRQLQALLVLGSAAVLAMEVLRLRVGFEWVLFDRLTREYEADGVAGYALFMLSITGVGLAFPPAVATAGMLMLAWGDPVGGVLSSNRPGSMKRPRALAATFLVCLFIGVGVLQLDGVVLGRALAAGAVGAAGATLADGLNLVIGGRVIDDNLLIPPAACAGILGVLAIL